jgi:hypothetical protein
MSKMLTACAAVAVTAVVALSGAANAAEPQSSTVRNADRIETNVTVRHHQRRAQRDWAPGSVYGEPYAYEPAYGAYPYADPNASVTRHGGAFGFGG